MPCLGQTKNDPLRSSLGIIQAPIAEVSELLKDFKPALPTTIGLFVHRAVPNGPAAKANMNGISIITRINKEIVSDRATFAKQMEKIDIGDVVELSGFQLAKTGNITRWKSFTTKVTAAAHRDVVLGALKIKDDPIKSLKFYHHPDSPKSVNERSELIAYISEGKDGPSLRLKMQFVGKDWLFIHSYTVHVDGKNYKVATPSTERDVFLGGIVEWDDRPASAEDLTMLRSIVSKKKALLRCEGDQYQKDRDLLPDEVSRIADILTAYDTLLP